ncbi:MAG: S8 family serine peptidase [Candidatus Acidiferrales bacterium]
MSRPAAAGKPGDIAPGRFLVRFRDSVEAPGAVAAELSQRHGFQVGHVYQYTIKGMAIRVQPQAERGVLNALSRDPRVEGVGHDRYIGLFAQTVPKGVNRINAEPGMAANNGNSIRVAIFDTGLDFNHPDLAANINFDLSADCEFFQGLGFCFQGGGFGQDDHWHGTFVGGVVAALNDGTDVIGVTPVAQLIAVKVLDYTGSGYFTDITAGVDYVRGLNLNASTRVHVANMSLGARCSVCTDNSSDLTVRAFHDAVRALVNSGTTLVVSAGNDGADAFDTVPASFDEVITVSAISDSDGQPGGLGPSQQLTSGPPMADDSFAWFSNFGPDVDVTGPGVLELSLNGSWMGTTTRISSGTSFSSPHAAGVAAMFYRHRIDSGQGLPSPGVVRQALIETGECHEGAGSVFHGTVGCAEVWPGDPDGLKEPLVRADNIDNFGGPPPVVNDVAVTSVSAPSPVFVGDAQTVLVGVANQGTQSENFSVSLADSLSASVGAAQNVNLGAGASTTLSFSWTPTVAGSHVLTATASTVTGESDTADNTKSATSTAQTPVHDVAVTNVSAPASVEQGQSAAVSVGVANQGTFAETFDVSLSATGGSVSGSPQEITLVAGASTTVNFTWNTTGAGLGMQTLTASAEVVSGETDTADNSGSASSEVTEPPSSPVHDVAVTGVSAPASVEQGQSATVGVQVANQGTVAETFAVSLSATGGSVSGSPQNVNLAAGGSTTVNFTWNTTGAAPGFHTLTASAAVVSGETDTADNSAVGVSEVTEPPPPPPSTMHVGDLDGSGSSVKNTWTATVTIRVHDSSHNPVSGAAVSVSWSGGFSGLASCVTNGSGACSVSTGSMHKKNGSVTLTVTNVSGSLTYQPGDNHDPDGDSNGTAITVLKP